MRRKEGIAMKATTMLLRSLLTLMVSTSVVFGQTASAPPSSLPIVPRLVNFSGRAADANGKVISGVAGVTFAIYRDQDGGAPLWIETQTVTADTKGNFNAQLGATKSDGLPLDLFTSGEARWLGVSINGGTEQPRVLLMSVPYALKAADAETLNGLPASAFMLAGSAPSGVTAASADAAGTPTASSSVPPPTTSNVTTTGGTINALPLFSTSTNIQNSIVSQTGTTSVSIKGKLALPATGTATATAGKNSQAQTLAASAFNSSTSTAVPQTFQWQAEPANNNTTTASGTLNLLFGQGTTAPAETGLKVASNGQITFATGQTFPGTGAGTITGVTTTSGSGLTGGGTSGALNLSLTNTCTTNQILKWSGTAWACATQASGGTVTSVALSAPTSDFTVTGSPITSAGTLGLNWTVAPTNANAAGAIVKRDANGAFSAGSIAGTISTPSGYAVGGFSTAGGYGVYGLDSNGTSIGVFGQSSGGYGVWGASSGGDGVHGESTGAGSGVNGRNVTTYGTGVTGTGGYYGVSGVSLGSFNTPGAGVSGEGANIGVYGSSASGYGVYGSGGYYGVYGTSNTTIAIGAVSTSTGEALYAENQSGGYAAVFSGDVLVAGNLSKNGGSFQIDHPTDPANKFLFHSFVESPDMMNIYNGNVTTDDHGDAVVTMPDWFEALNRDFRYQLTVMGQFAQAIVAEKMSGNRFSIKTDKPNVEVSWQVTGVRHDAWANAHRIPVEREKPEAQRGLYLNPELFGAPAGKSIVLARHPEILKQRKQPTTEANASSKP